MVLCCNKGAVSGFTRLSNGGPWTLCCCFVLCMLFLRVVGIAERGIADRLVFQMYLV